MKQYSKQVKRALLRVDFNVPIDKGKITDFTRIKSTIPTITYLLNLNYNIIIMSHFGRPKGWDNNFSLRLIVAPLSKMLGKDVAFYNEHILNNTIRELPLEEVILLENIRFYKEETTNDYTFSKHLSQYGDIYVNDAFGVSHREHASVHGVKQFFKDNKYKGILIEQELKALNKIKQYPPQPLTLIIGGSKVSSKINLLEYFLGTADNIIIGGGMAFPFIKLLNGEIGKSFCKDSELLVARSFMKKAEKTKTKIILPLDCIASAEIKSQGKTLIVDIKDIPDNYMGLDIGPKSIKLFTLVISQSKSILWNGPMGVFEINEFSEGTNSIARAITDELNKETYSLAGGGDTLAAISKIGINNKFSYLSTGGGAMLEFFQDHSLPGVTKLKSLVNLTN
jgi:phosphoglycerate kinase